MADVVELMDFWPMDDDENIGFVAADSDFQLWLISGIGVGFEDISYAVIDGPDSSGIYELIMDYEDYLNLADLYSEYLETGWAELEEEDFDEVFAAPSDENIEVTFKIQDADMKTFYYTTDAPSGLSDEDIVTYVWGVPSSFNREDNMYHLPYDWEGVGDHFFAKIMSSEEEGNAPIQDPMEFGEMANWTPLDGTPSLKRRKDAEGSGEINIGPVYVTKKVPVLFKHDYVTKDYHWSTDEPSYLTDDQEEELVEIVEQIVEDTDSIRGHETFDEYDYKGDVSWDTYKDDGRFYDLAAEGANPSGGATGDQIISWEHNGLSSPSGPPSDIFWSEGSDIRLDAESFEAKGYTTHWKYGTCRGYFGDENHRTNIICDGCGNYACEDCGREPPYIVKQSQPDMRYWCDNCYAKWSDYAFEAEDFNAQMGHSRFQKSDNPRRDIESSTRRKLKQEMFSDVSGVVNTKNMAIVGIAGIVGYLLARK